MQVKCAWSRKDLLNALEIFLKVAINSFILCESF